MKYPIAILNILLAFNLSAQVNISGAWVGTITQEEGGVAPAFDFELFFVQKGKKLTGRSYVYFDGKYAVMDIVGTFLDDQTLIFNETKMIDFHELENMSWCIKGGRLKVLSGTQTWRLEGNWQGYTDFGPCVPGRIFLQKEVPRA